MTSSTSIPSSTARPNSAWFSAGALELRRGAVDGVVEGMYWGGDGVLGLDFMPESPLLSLLEPDWGNP